MDFKKLIIGFIHYSKTKQKVVISGGFLEDTSFEASKKSNGYFINSYRNKSLKITGKTYEVHTAIIDVEVSSSIADFKNVHFLTDLKEVGQVSLNDIIQVID